MDIKDLKVFQAIAKEESITKASRILYMTPQGISKIVKNLEAEMGCRLFTRNKAGMLLTESGKRFLEYADKEVLTFDAEQIHITLECIVIYETGKISVRYLDGTIVELK